MKPKHQRLIFVVGSAIFLCISALLVLRAFSENLVFFYSPEQVMHSHIDANVRLRVGGLVEKGSVNRKDNVVQFRITDGTDAVAVRFSGLLPNLFREGQGVVAEGYLTAPGEFKAEQVLAKHDENYMPKEVVDVLKKSGRWKGQ